MPTVQGTDDFNHAIDAGYYADGFFGAPTAVTSPLYQSNPKSLSIVADGGNQGVRHNVSGTPTRGWAAFAFRAESLPVAATTAVCTFGTAGGVVPALYMGSVGIYASIAGVDGTELAISADTWYWVECIADVSGATRRMHYRVGGVDGTTAEHTDVATTISWHQFISFAGDTSAVQRYYSWWNWGEAASASDWLGEPAGFRRSQHLDYDYSR